jgi:hypothetical protein
MSLHAADAEDGFFVFNVTPDFCKVGNRVVPYDIYQFLPSEKANYTQRVHALKKKLLTVGSIVAGVKGNAGKGFFSGVSQGKGDNVVINGVSKVRVEGKRLGK